MKSSVFYIEILVITLFISSCHKNKPPVVTDIQSNPSEIRQNSTITLKAIASDPDGDNLKYNWISIGGTIDDPTNQSVQWSPSIVGNVDITVEVSDQEFTVPYSKSFSVLPGLANISGFVYYSGTTIPISGVVVMINSNTITTNSSGSYTLLNLFSGSVTLTASKSGYELYSKPITLAAGENSYNIEMTSGTYTQNVYGYVKDENNSPMSGLTVTLLNPDNTASDINSSTDAAGYYQLSSVPQGSRTLTISVSDENYLDQEVTIIIEETVYPFNLTISSIYHDLEYNSKIYRYVKIGSQYWMAENLATTNYNDGGTIPLVENSDAWKINYTPAYCIYANNKINKDIYGLLYNWYTIKTGKLCPLGWHILSKEDWVTLITFLGGSEVAGGKLKEVGRTHWYLNGGATDEYHFTALPGGIRLKSGTLFPDFLSITYIGDWWSSTEADYDWAWHITLNNGDATVSIDYQLDKESGASVRCIKD